MFETLTRWGRGAPKGVLPEVEEAVKDDEKIGELEKIIHDTAPLYALEGNAGWKTFLARIDGMDAALTAKLKKASTEVVPLIQAQIALLEDVKSLVPKALDASKLAREELDRLFCCPDF